MIKCNDKNAYCTICLQTENYIFLNLNCNHKFHANCILEYLKICKNDNNNFYCPLCRDLIIQIEDNDLYYIELNKFLQKIKALNFEDISNIDDLFYNENFFIFTNYSNHNVNYLFLVMIFLILILDLLIIFFAKY